MLFMPNLLLCIAPLQRRSKTTETVAPVDIFRAIWNYLETAEDEGLTARDGQKQTHIGRSSICQAFFRPGEGPSWALNPTGSLCQQSTFPREQDFQRPEAPSRGAHRPFRWGGSATHESIVFEADWFIEVFSFGKYSRTPEKR